jgi:hypothetical protein
MTLLDACGVRFGRGADSTDGVAFAIEAMLSRVASAKSG